MALISVVPKCLKMVVYNLIILSVVDHLDPLQYVYRLHCGVSDAALTLLDAILQDLDTFSTYASVMFMEFSNAFNIVQPHLLLKLERMGLKMSLTGIAGSDICRLLNK